MTTIVWFRQDLRIADNPALAHACTQGDVLPLYILDQHSDGVRPLGAASRWWLHHSLDRLRSAFGGLVIAKGQAAAVIDDLIGRTGAKSIAWNRCYEPWAISRDKALKARLTAQGLDVRSYNASLLHEPWDIETGSGGPFKVFTPFWRACLRRAVASPLPRPSVKLATLQGLGIALEDLDLTPKTPNWAASWDKHWSPGEAGAHSQLTKFLKDGIAGYGELRNRPDLANVSRLSPHLHFGEISPRTIWWNAAMAAECTGFAQNHRADVDKFLSEIGWREFAYHLLFHFPSIPQTSWKPAFDAYPWQQNAAALAAWQKGRTGYPMVDAGMRELWSTGTMHNRVRMIAASFLVKHLRIHWREGEAWFWDTLLDADLANNVAGWQWVAGSGADAAPYFRIFNPMEQGRKFDPDGHYVRRWCPELAKLPTPHLHAPFEAPPEILAEADIRLGQTYPHPIVEHRAARLAALDGYATIKSGNPSPDRRK